MKSRKLVKAATDKYRRIFIDFIDITMAIGMY